MSRNPLALGASLFPTPAELDTRSASSSFAGAPLLRLPKKKFFSVQGKLRKFGVIPRTVSTSCKESSARSALGPSLRRGRIEPETFAERDTRQNDAADGLAVRNKRYVTGADIDRAAFTRVYDVAALRVPSDQSEELAYKLKGHLLNWPRIKNIARVTGDQLDEDIEKLWWNGQKKEQAVNDSVRKAVFLEDTLPPAVKTRERITKKELKRRFPHLEALTRPKGTASFLKHKKGKDQGSSYKSNMVEAKGLTRSTWEEKAVVVEIDEAAACTGQSSEQLQGFWGLLEEGKLSRRYRGSTRLLLLDERFAGKPLSEIPMALQVWQRRLCHPYSRDLPGHGCECIVLYGKYIFISHFSFISLAFSGRYFSWKQERTRNQRACSDDAETFLRLLAS